ncbi:Cytochrome c-551 precursor [compost metagenome]
MDLAGARLASSGTCVACHAADRKMIGPSYQDVAAKYRGNTDAHALLAQKIRQGGGGTWGAMPMPPNPGVSDDDLKRIVDWILAGAPAPG